MGRWAQAMRRFADRIGQGLSNPSATARIAANLLYADYAGLGTACELEWEVKAPSFSGAWLASGLASGASGTIATGVNVLTFPNWVMRVRPTLGSVHGAWVTVDLAK